jgi:hypothetical protein
VPAIVLTPLGTDPGTRLLLSLRKLREMADGHRRLAGALAASVTRGEHRELGNARHSTITIDRADAVIQAIRDLLGQVTG